MKYMVFCLIVVFPVVLSLMIPFMHAHSAAAAEKSDLIDEMSLVVVFDNMEYDKKCTTNWGFS